jgi:hypothetical protein
MTSPSEASEETADPAPLDPASLEVRVLQHLAACTEINALCTQNGWIDDETVVLDVVARGPDHLVASVEFEEIVMEGAGCVAGRIPCYGRVKASFAPTGEVNGIEVL